MLDFFSVRVKQWRENRRSRLERFGGGATGEFPDQRNNGGCNVIFG